MENIYIINKINTIIAQWCGGGRYSFFLGLLHAGVSEENNFTKGLKYIIKYIWGCRVGGLFKEVRKLWEGKKV